MANPIDTNRAFGSSITVSKTAPPNSIINVWRIKIEPITSTNLLFSLKCSKTFAFSDLVFKLLKIIEYIKNANINVFTYISTFSQSFGIISEVNPPTFFKIRMEMIVMKMDEQAIADFIYFVRILSVRNAGLSFIYLSKIGSPPNAIAARVSIIRLIQRIWTIENGSTIPRTGARIFISNVLILTVSWKIKNFPTDFAIVLLFNIQSFIEVNELLRITTSPAS